MRRGMYEALMDPEGAHELSITRQGFLVTGSAALVALNGRAAEAAESGGTSAPVEFRTTLNVNGMERTLTLDPRVTLLDALRDQLGLTGTKKGCDQGACGACTVHVNGERIVSCLTLAAMHDGDRITTIEGVGQRGALHPVQAAFIKHDSFQCGYCTPGQIMSSVALLAEGHTLNRETVQVQMSGNICRCGCYPHIVDAILEAGGA